MMSRFKRWLVQRFLPVWAKETILDANKRLEYELAKLREENARLRAYAEGLELGLHAARAPQQIEVRCIMEPQQKGGTADGPCESTD